MSDYMMLFPIATGYILLVIRDVENKYDTKILMLNFICLTADTIKNLTRLWSTTVMCCQVLEIEGENKDV